MNSSTTVAPDEADDRSDALLDDGRRFDQDPVAHLVAVGGRSSA